MPDKSEVMVRFGGAAGDGAGSTGETFAKLCSRKGLHAYAYTNYQSVIRGGHLYLQVRVGPDKLTSHGDGLDILIALNQDTMDRYAGVVNAGGALIYNKDKISISDDHVAKGVKVCPFPFLELTRTFGAKPNMQNTTALGILLYLLKLEFSLVETMLK